jgi:oligoribonuclease
MIFWLDLETTGLNPDKDAVLEVALIVTEDNLTVRETYHAVIQQSQTTMDNMNDWCKNQHSKSGLIADVWGPNSKTHFDVNEDLKEIAAEYSPSSDRAIMAGSSVHFDRSFTRVNFNRFTNMLSYRILDVSSFKEGLRRFHGIEYLKQAEAAHRAMPDILGSIEEYKFYMNRLGDKGLTFEKERVILLEEIASLKRQLMKEQK